MKFTITEGGYDKNWVVSWWCEFIKEGGRAEFKTFESAIEYMKRKKHEVIGTEEPLKRDIIPVQFFGFFKTAISKKIDVKGGCKWLSQGPAFCECPMCQVDRMNVQELLQTAKTMEEKYGQQKASVTKIGS
jgi:hypothetical protein